MSNIRLLKWIGDPPVLKEDGWSVYNWKYENSRSYPLYLPKDHKGSTSRILEKGTHGIRETYVFTNSNGFMTEVHERDARIILLNEPNAFRDVTNSPDPSKVRNVPLIRTKSGLTLEFARR